MKTLSLFLSWICLASVLQATSLATHTVRHELDGKTFESTVTWVAGPGDLPGIFMVPNWMGPTGDSLEKAQKIAKMGYVVMMADVYGTDVRPTNAKEAGVAAAVLRGDRPLMRARAGKALEAFLADKTIPLMDGYVAAIGFCFGGGTVLELARAGADVDAVISFHGDLASPTLAADSGNITSKVLVLHGAMDPYVPQGDVTAFIDAMSQTSVDWQLVQFAKTVHSFTNPKAASKGASEYNPLASARAFEYMQDLLDELWAD